MGESMRTSFVLFAVGILALALSQGQGEAQPGIKGAFDLNAKATSVKPNGTRFPHTLSNQQLESLISDLQESVASLKKEVATLKAGLNKANSSLETVKSGLGAPKGYTTMYITRANLDHVEGTALM